MATYVNDLRLKEIATGDESGTWGASTNTNLELIAEAFSFGTEAITTNADTHTTTIADGSTDPGRSIYLKYTGTLDSACTITIGPNTVSKLWFIENGTSGSQNIIISQGSGANVTIPNGHVKAVYSDGAGSGAAMVDAFTDVNLAGTTTVDVLSGSGNATIGGTLGVTGAVTADAGVSIDNITIDGTEIDLSSGDLSIDVAGNLQIDADDNGEIRFLDGGTQYAAIKKDGNNALFQSIVADGDFIIQGIDGSSFVSALTLDMSDAGSAYFNNKVGVGTTSPQSGIHLAEGGTGSDGGSVLTLSQTGFGTIVNNDDLGSVHFGGVTGGGVGIHNAAKILVEGDGTWANNDYPTRFTFHTTVDGASSATEKMRIDNAGNLMVGTTSTTPADGVSPAVLIGNSSDSTSGLVLSNSSHNWLLYNDSDGDFNIYDSDNNADRFTIDGSGNVAINNGELSTTHAATAHTSGLNIINSQAGGYGSALKLQSERSDNNAIVTAARIRTEGAEAWNADSAVSSAFIFESIENNALQEIMRFTSNGRCLIGTSSAIGSGSNGHGLDVFSVGGGPHVMNLKNSDTSGGANMIRFIDGSGDVCGEINSNATNNNTTYGTSSDGRYKDVIGEARGLEIINSLNPVKFTWKSSGEEDEGLIAQEVLEIVPNAVTGSEETKYMMDYSRLVTPLIKAIQEQQKEIEELKQNSHPPKSIQEMEGYDELMLEINKLKGE